MTANEMKNAARNATVETLRTSLIEADAVQFGDASYAILQVVDGQEIWTEVTVKSKAYKPTKTCEAFDPYMAAEAWKEELRIKKENKAAAKKKEEA